MFFLNKMPSSKTGSFVLKVNKSVKKIFLIYILSGGDRFMVLHEITNSARAHIRHLLSVRPENWS